MKPSFLLALGLILANGQASQTYRPNPIPGSSPRNYHTFHVQRTRSLPSSSTLSDSKEESISLLQDLLNSTSNHLQQKRERSSDSSDDNDLNGEFVVSVFSRSGKTTPVAIISIEDSEESRASLPSSQEQHTQALMTSDSNIPFLDQVKKFERAFKLLLIQLKDPVALLSSTSQSSDPMACLSEDELSQKTKMAVSHAQDIFTNCLLNKIKSNAGLNIIIQGENLIEQILNRIEILIPSEAGPLLNSTNALLINGRKIQLFHQNGNRYLTLTVQ